jgi:integrase
MATVRKLPSGKWNAQVRRKGHTPISKSFVNQKDAHTWIRSIESAMDKGTGLAAYGLINAGAEVSTLNDALVRYRDEITPTKKGSKQELRRIAMWIEHPLAKKKLNDLRPSDFVKHRDVRLKEVASNTVRLELALISHLFNIAKKEWNVHINNPLADIRKPKPSNSRTRRLEDDEEERLLKACKGSRNAHLYPLVVLAIETGMRLSELLKIEWNDVNLDKRIIFLSDTKNGNSRTIPLSMRASAVIESIPKGIKCNRVFWHWTPRSDAMNGAFLLAVRRAGIDNFHFHDLRHEAVSRLFEKGLNVLEVASISGHKTVQMLSRYTHIRPESLLGKLDMVGHATKGSQRGK